MKYGLTLLCTALAVSCGDIIAARDQVEQTDARLRPVPPPPLACRSDSDCGFGDVCEFCSASRTGECVAGCRTDRECKPPEICQPVTCVACPCPSQCSAPVPPPPPACSSDRDCKGGEVCEGCSTQDARCLPGCRANSDCLGSAQRCVQVQCVTCPCPALCQ